MLPGGGSRSRGLLGIEETTGARSSMQKPPTERSWRKIHYASRLPRIVAKQDYLSAILLRICRAGDKNVIRITVLIVKIIVTSMTIGVCSTARKQQALYRRFLARRFDLVLILCGSRVRRPRRLSATWDNDWGSFPDSTMRDRRFALLFLCLLAATAQFPAVRHAAGISVRRPRIPRHRLSRSRPTRRLPAPPRKRPRTR